MAKKKKEAEENAEQPEKSGKKKLLIPLAAVAVVAVAAAVVLLVLPKFGINLLGGGEVDEATQDAAPPKKGLEVYALGEESVPSLDTVLEEGDGELFALREPGKKKKKDDGDKSASSGSSAEDSQEEDLETFTYIYELSAPADAVNRYLDLMLGGEQGFSLVDGDFLAQKERPELVNESGSLTIGRNSTAQEGRVFRLAIGWSDASGNLVVRAAAPEGSVHQPKPESKPEAASLDEHMKQIMAMKPSELGLTGESMEEYEVYAMGGFVKVDDLDCRRFTIYSRDDPGSIAGIFMISSDKKHFFQLDRETGGVTELR